ncbi:MAG: hypothetical protein E7366_05700 [Clostridiales bacterium]|nr:hypothetical protein [Clostridiales bacterium]
MKLEKREITLNEIDSVKDAFVMQKILLNEYVMALEKVERKETRGELTRLLQDSCEDLFFLCDVQRRLADEKI